MNFLQKLFLSNAWICVLSKSNSWKFLKHYAYLLSFSFENSLSGLFCSSDKIVFSSLRQTAILFTAYIVYCTWCIQVAHVHRRAYKVKYVLECCDLLVDGCSAKFLFQISPMILCRWVVWCIESRLCGVIIRCGCCAWGCIGSVGWCGRDSHLK